MKAALLAVALALIGCDPISGACFAPPSEVKDVRILAVAADPPEARFDPVTGIADPVVLRALIVQPTHQLPAAKVTWEVCAPAEDSPDCPPGSEVASDPEWGPASSLRVQVPAAVLQRSIALDPLHGLRDVRVRALVRVQEERALPATGGGRQAGAPIGAPRVSASVLLLFSSRPGPLNRAPIIAGLRAARDGKPLEDLLPGNPVLVMSEQHTTAIRPVLAPDALEEYDSVDLTGNPVHLRERVTYSFYADDKIALGRGLTLKEGATAVVIYRGLDDFEADEPEPGTPDTSAGLFSAVPVFAGGSNGVVWIVARDSRGATSWMSVPYHAAEERPQCLGPPPHMTCPELRFGCL